MTLEYDWDNWLVVFLGWNHIIPYIWDVDFYDTGLLNELVTGVVVKT